MERKKFLVLVQAREETTALFPHKGVQLTSTYPTMSLNRGGLRTSVTRKSPWFPLSGIISAMGSTGLGAPNPAFVLVAEQWTPPSIAAEPHNGL